MKSLSDVRTGFLDFFARATATPSCRPRRWCRATTPPCCSPMPAWCSSRTSSPARRSGPTAAPPRCRNACAPAASTTTSTMSATPPATTPSSRCWAISPSAIISRKRRSRFAWDFVTKTVGLPKDRLLVTVYPTDDEARAAVEEDRRPSRRHASSAIESNFWSMGPTGPCGYLLGNLLRPGRQRGRRPARQSPDEDGDRFLEFWNLVFMQFEQVDENTRARSAQAVHRHRHGAGAHRRHPAGRAQQLRHRSVPPSDRGLGRSLAACQARARRCSAIASSPTICARPPS